MMGDDNAAHAVDWTHLKVKQAGNESKSSRTPPVMASAIAPDYWQGQH